MDRIITDNSKVNIFLLKENELLKKQLETATKLTKMKNILEDLEILILQNEDDFDRGSGKFILQNFIKEKQAEQLTLTDVSNCKRDETLELLEEIMTKVKEANEEVENGIYDPMLEVAKHILNNYKIERR